MMKKRISESYNASLQNSYKIIAPLTEPYRLKDFTPAVIANIYNQIEEARKEEHEITAKEELKILFLDSHIKKAQFCRSTGFSLCTLQDVFQGHKVNRKTAERLSNLLVVDETEIFEIQLKFVKFKSDYLDNAEKFIKYCLAGAVRLGVIEKNYADNFYISYKHADAEKVKSMTLDETKQLFQYAMQAAIPKRLAIVLLLVTGMRKGELCGLD